MNYQTFYYHANGFEAARELPELGLHGHSFSLSALGESASVADELDAVCNSLDYKYLNDLSNVNSDLGLALSMAEKLPSATELRLRSAPYRGVALHEGRALNWLHSRFEAAHHLPNVPEGHKCGRLHGHGFQVVLYADSSTTAAELAAQWESWRVRLDGHYLNKMDGLENPTSEVLAQWLWQRMKPEFDALALVVVQETVTAGCSFDGEYHRIWKQQDAECALYIPSQTEPLGHSYTIRLHLQAPLDEVMGWTVDYGDVKRLFKPAYDRLDHHCINDLLEEGAEPSATNVALWLQDELSKDLPELYRVDVLEKPFSGVVLEKPMNTAKAIASVPRLMI